MLLNEVKHIVRDQFIVNPVPANQINIKQAAELLRQGKLVAIPTETVYGLGADAMNPQAVNKIFAAKGRPADHPLIVHIADVSQLTAWALDIPESAYNLAECFWPGPLTLVLKKQSDVPYEVTGGQDTVALRIPNHPVALAVLKAFGGGIAAPSANRYCRISPTQASHVEEELGDKVDMILDGGACQVGLESTIVDLSSVQAKLLRPGQIGIAAIEAVLQRPLAVPDDTETIRAPGRAEVHYSPNTKTLLCAQAEIIAVLLDAALRQRFAIGVIAYSANAEFAGVKAIGAMPQEVDGYAQALYQQLRAMDEKGLDLILIEQPPMHEDWRAVNDRLSKAAKLYRDENLRDNLTR